MLHWVSQVVPDFLPASIAYTPEWKALQEHVEEIKRTYVLLTCLLAPKSG